jgi:hypothetical protein
MTGHFRRISIRWETLIGLLAILVLILSIAVVRWPEADGSKRYGFRVSPSGEAPTSSTSRVPVPGRTSAFAQQAEDAEGSRALVAALSAPNTPIFVSGSMTIGKEVAAAFNLSPAQRAATEELLRGFALKIADWEKAHSSVKVDETSGLSYVEIQPYPEGERALAELRRALEPVLGVERAEAMVRRIRKEPFFGMVGRFRQEWFYSEEVAGSQTFPVFKVTIHRDDGESSIAMPPSAPAIEQRFGPLLGGLRK